MTPNKEKDAHFSEYNEGQASKNGMKNASWHSINYVFLNNEKNREQQDLLGLREY